MFTTKAGVAQFLNVRLSKLTYLLDVLPADRRYISFELQRKSGTPRIIQAPIKPLKAIQAALATGLAGHYRPRRAVHGYVRNRSIVTNARIHRRQRWVLRVDLTDFFPSINFGRVRGLFLKLPYLFPPDVATLIAQICCHNNQLPQGAPTSPLISNLICRRLDRDLARLAVSERAYYTRYCDDLVFSTNRTFMSQNLAVIDDESGRARAGPSLVKAVEENGFHINNAKTVLRKRTQRQMVTGLVTNSFVNVPRDYVKSVRSLLYIWRRHGELAAAESLMRHRHRNRPSRRRPAELPPVVRGKIQYIGAIKGWSSSVYRSFATSLEVLDPRFKRTRKLLKSPPTLFKILTEGPTDHIHLSSAIRYFQNRSEFTDLDLSFEADNEGSGGDEELLKTCQAFQRGTPQNPPAVCIFDRDNRSMVAKVTTPGALFKTWGNNVFSMTISHPAHRDPLQPLCVELLFTDEVIRTGAEQGRRLYLASEFDPETGRHNTEPVYSRFGKPALW